MTLTFSKDGITFQYPKNWILEETEQEHGNRAITLNNPEGAIWALSIHPNATPPDQLADAGVEAVRSEYEQVESEPVTEVFGDIAVSGYEMHFFCLDLTISAKILCFRDHRNTYALFWQAEDHVLQNCREVFDALGYSLISGMENVDPA
jgi:hypothetical protein